MVVMDDRVLLLEVKDWNGVLTCNGDNWLLDGQPRGRSPVYAVAHKARVLAKSSGTGSLASGSTSTTQS